MPSVKDHLRELVLRALLDMKRAGTLTFESEPDFVIERTKSREHGDYASNVALLLSKAAGRKPRPSTTPSRASRRPVTTTSKKPSRRWSPAAIRPPTPC